MAAQDALAGTEAIFEKGIDRVENAATEHAPASSNASDVADKEPSRPDHEYITGLKLTLVIIPITLAYFLVMLDSSIIATAIPQITVEFDSLLDVGWYGSAYQLAGSAFQPLSGKIYSNCSIKWSFLSFFAVFEVGSAICGAAQTSTMLIVGRAIAGLGFAGLMNGAMTILAATVPVPRQPAIMGINVGLGQLGIALGPIIGGAFTDHVSWRWCFYVNLPIGAVVVAALLLIRIPEMEVKPPFAHLLRNAVQILDLVGFVLIAPAAIMFFLALQYGGNQYSWNSSVVIGLLIGALATFVVFLLWEWRRGDDAMIPFSMLRQRIIWAASGTMFMFMGVLFCGGYYLPIYFQAVKNNSALVSGVHILPAIISQVIFAMTSGGMVEALGYYLPWVVGGSAFTAIGYGLLSLLSPATSVARWVGYEIVFGIGCGAAATGSYIAIQNLVTPAKIPIAMAIMIFFQNLGGGLWLTVGQTLFTNTLRSEIHQRVPGINADVIVGAGARNLRALVTPEQLPEFLTAYSKAVGAVFYLGAALGVASLMFAFGLGWKDVRVEKKKLAQTKEDSEQPSKSSSGS